MSQLRAFAKYGNTVPYNITSGPDTASIPGNLVDFDGYVAAAGWLQFFDSVAAPTGGAVPLKSINIPGAGMISSLLTSLGPVPFLNGMWVAMSSSEGTYTAAATSFDAWGELEEWDALYEQALFNATVVGDQTTQVNNLAVASGGTATRRVLRILFTNPTLGVGTAWWGILRDVTNQAVLAATPLVAGVDRTLSFGSLGIISPAGGGYGFTAYVSNSPIAAVLSGGNTAAIKVWYNTL